jgi:predicted nucleic acid-binding protein
MDRLFLDANVLFSAAYKTETGLLRLWTLKNVTLCSSRYALEEAMVNLADEVQRIRLAGLSKAIHFFEAAQTELPQGISLPKKDAPILLAAIEARATHLLTGDLQHFGPYLGRKIAGIKIALPGEYFRLRTSR